MGVPACQKCARAIPAQRRLDEKWGIVARDGRAHLTQNRGETLACDGVETEAEKIARLEAEVAEYEDTLPWLKIISANKEIARLEAEVAELKEERDLYRQAFGYVTIGDVTLEIGDDWDVDGGTVLVNDKPVEWSKDLDIAKAVVAARDGDEKRGLLEE